MYTAYYCICVMRSVLKQSWMLGPFHWPTKTTTSSQANAVDSWLIKSVILKKDGGHHILVVESGFGSFSTKYDGEQVRALDLISAADLWTVAFDLSKDFSTPNLHPLWQYKKPNGSLGPPITNHGAMWLSEDQNMICYQGGHYYNAPHWNTSWYNVPKSPIPPWQLWQMDVTKHQDGWTDVTNSTNEHGSANRAFAAAATSVPAAQKSLLIGGLFDSTTSADNPNNKLETTDQMLVFDHPTNTITRQKYYSPSSTEGAWHGDLVHLPIGSGSGYLMSLMSLQRPVNHPWDDEDGTNGGLEVGDNVTLDSIPLYDIDTTTWFEQDTAWFMDQVPEPRTRFCSALFQDEIDNTWNLWVHGGQQLSDQNIGVREIYVLSMPSFIWTKIETTLSDTNLIRSHTCHAVGSQFVIVGGYPPGVEVPTNATCDAEYVKVLNIGQDSISWTGAYVADTKYSTPQSIRTVINQRDTPIAGFANPKLQEDFEYSSKEASKTRGTIAGAVVGAVIGLVIIAVAVWWYLRLRNKEKLQENLPASPRYGQPMPVEDGFVHENNRRPSSAVVEVNRHSEGRELTQQHAHELEAQQIKEV